MKGNSQPRKKAMNNMGNNKVNQNNMFNQINIMPIRMNNFININPNINLINSPNNFFNFGGAINNKNQINNMNQFNNKNQLNNFNNNIQFNNMNQINNNNNQFNNMNQINNNQFNNMNQWNNIMNKCNNMNQRNNMNQLNNKNQINVMNQKNKNNMNLIMQNNFVQPVLNNANNNNFAFTFRKCISNEIPKQNNLNNAKGNSNFPMFNSTTRNYNEDINMKFSFISAQSFKVSGKPYEKLSEVINRFKTKCPQDLKKFLNNCLYNAGPVDKNKTLQELGIRNGDQILFIRNKNPKNEYKMNHLENNRYNKFRAEYLSLKILNDIENQKKHIDSNDFENYVDFYNKKDKSSLVLIKEHKHLLAYCLTNFNWKCNICYTNYDKSRGRYYCSKCNFNICQRCHYNAEYFPKKSFPKNTVPSNSSIKENFLNTDYHEHTLVYCRCSKNLTYYNDWTCDNCRGNYTNDIWLFYCTLCDYHLCANCCGYQ